MSRSDPNKPQDLPLEPGEYILWSERPDPSAYVKQRYGRLTALGVILLGLIFFAVQDVIKRNNSLELSLNSSDFWPVLITLVLMTTFGSVLATSMLWGRKEAENTCFYLTNTRLIILRGISPPQVLSYPPHSVTQLDTVMAKDGYGTLYFRVEKPLLYGGLYKKKIGFEGIRDLSTLYGRIHKAFYH